MNISMKVALPPSLGGTVVLAHSWHHISWVGQGRGPHVGGGRVNYAPH